MTVELFAQVLKKSILSLDEISVPGLGKFVSEFVPASFSDKGHSINPPYRSLSFVPFPEGEPLASNPFQDVSDGDLAEVVAEIGTLLESDGSVVLPELGKLCVSSAGSVFFVADFDLDIYPDGFGLKTISLKSHRGASVLPDEPKMPQNPLDIVVEPVLDPEPTTTPSQPANDPVAPSQPADAPEPTSTPVENPSKGGKCGRVLIALVALFVLGLVFLRIAAILAPDFVDSILYTPEQLELLGK